MNDETKAELMKRTREWLQSCVNAATRSGVPDEADLEAFILAHLDGEPARLAAAREEQRAHDIARSRKAKYTLTGGKNSLAGAWNAGIESAIEGVMSTPLDATPLDATPLAERDRLRTWVSTVSEALGAIEPVSDCRVELGADAAASVAASLRARVAALEAERDEVTVTLSTAVMWTVAPELVAANHKRAAQEAFDALERLRARVAELEADASRARRIGYELTLETQTLEEMAADLVRIARQSVKSAEQAEARVTELEAMRAEHRKIAVDNVNAAYAEAARMQQIARTAEAQVAAARAVCERPRPPSRDANDVARRVLRAMDEATKK